MSTVWAPGQHIHKSLERSKAPSNVEDTTLVGHCRPLPSKHTYAICSVVHLFDGFESRKRAGQLQDLGPQANPSDPDPNLTSSHYTDGLLG